MEAGTDAKTGEDLERELEELLDIESFEPPEEFAAAAAISDESIADEAAEDPVGYWEEKASELDWFERWDTALDDSDPPFYKWFDGGKLNASHNCLDRHVENGLGDRVAFHWRGEEGEERDVTYADLHRDVQKLANALKDRGIERGDVVGIFLPMIPEVAVAMLACARIGAPHNVVFGGFSPDSVKRSDAVLRCEGADHGRWRAAQGQDRGDQAGGGRFPGRRPVDRDRRGGAQHGQRRGDEGRARRLLRRGDRRCRRRVRGRAARRRASPFHPLHVGLDRAAEGHPAYDRRLPDGRRGDDEDGLRPAPGRRRLLVLSRRRLGYRPLLHRLRPAAERGDLGDVRGRSRLPPQGDLVGAVRALRRDDLLHGADRDPRLHEVGRTSTPTKPTSPRCACWARSASRSTRRPGCGTGR